MTDAQMMAIASPATGLFIYNTNAAAFYYYDGTSWVGMSGGSGPASPWDYNSATNEANFIKGNSKSSRLDS